MTECSCCLDYFNFFLRIVYVMYVLPQLSQLYSITLDNTATDREVVELARKGVFRVLRNISEYVRKCQ